MTDLANYLQPDSRLIGRLVAAVCVAATLALAWQGARLTWALWPRPDYQAAPPQPVQPGAVTGAARRIDTDALAARHLFGRAERSTPAVAPADAPETRLNLQLGGIYYSTVQSHSRAMIDAGRDDDALYAVGDELPGGARIDGIYPTKVILVRGGRREALTMKLDDLGDLSSQTPAEPAESSEAGVPGDAASATLARYRDEILQDPSSIQRLLQPVPVQDESGNLIGFRVQPGDDPGLFRATGLQPGDLVTAIGGIPLTSQDAALQAMQNIGTANRLTLTVRRDGVQQRVVLDFGQ